MIVDQEHLSKTKEQVARDLRNLYLQQWRKNNPEKAKEHRNNYWKRKAEEVINGSNDIRVTDQEDLKLVEINSEGEF